MMETTTTNQIAAFSNALLVKAGVPSPDAAIITDSIVYAHSRGKHTHGVVRLPIYIRKIERGLMTAETLLESVEESPAVSVFDAAHGFGQVAAARAMERCVKKASQYGIAAVGVRNSNNFGTAGFVVEAAADHKMIGLVFSNSAPAMAPWGGDKPLLGTNPLGIAFPRANGEPPIVLDMATAVAARGKIRLAAKNGEEIPLGWALDEFGNPTDDPVAALKGTLLPVGGPKGYGLSLAVDILAGLLTGSAFGGEVNPLNISSGRSANGHFMIAINISHFMKYEMYLERIAVLVENIKKSGDQENRVFLPGERFIENRTDNENSVPLAPVVTQDLNDLAEQYEIDLRICR